MQQVFANNANSLLALAISSTDTTLYLTPGTGAGFSQLGVNQFFLVTLTDALTRLLTEIVTVTAIDGDTLTVVRAQEGTLAQLWLAGDLVAEQWTAGSATSMIQAAGGTMTGPLVLSADPTTSLEAATKAYVDAALGYFAANPIVYL